MSTTEADGTQKETNRKHALLEAEIVRLTNISNDDISAIRAAAALNRKPLEDRITQLREVEATDVRVCEFRLKQQVEEARRSIFPGGIEAIQRLPMEMLSQIFKYYVAENLSPWSLTKVSKEWKRVAMMTPQLWDHIKVQDVGAYEGRMFDGWVVDGIKHRSYGRHQICFTPSQAQAALRRSGAVPLIITIVNLEGRVTPASIASCLSLLLSEAISVRIQHLRFDWPRIHDIASDSDVTLGRFPLLRTIEWHGTPSYWVQELFESVSATSYCLEMAYVGCPLTSELASLSFWNCIRTFQLPRHYSRVDLNKIASKLHSITGFFSGPSHWPDHNTPICTWGRIHHLNLRCDILDLNRLILPELDSLRLSQVVDEHHRDQDIGNPPQIEFPTLRTLELFTMDPRSLSRFSMPLLTKLHLHYSATYMQRGALPRLFAGISFPNVEECLLGYGWADQTVVAALESLPNVIELRMEGFDQPGFCRATTVERLTDSEQICCPKLKSLRLGDWEGPAFMTRDDMVPLMKSLVASRKKMGKPLQKFKAYLSTTRAKRVHDFV